jgi:hypothetical protein
MAPGPDSKSVKVIELIGVGARDVADTPAIGPIWRVAKTPA